MVLGLTLGDGTSYYTAYGIDVYSFGSGMEFLQENSVKCSEFVRNRYLIVPGAS